jgi:hypothetical protein
MIVIANLLLMSTMFSTKSPKVEEEKQMPEIPRGTSTTRQRSDINPKKKASTVPRASGKKGLVCLSS